MGHLFLTTKFRSCMFPAPTVVNSFRPNDIYVTVGVIFDRYCASNIITLGECGSFPPSVNIQAICLMYLMRIQALSENSILKQTFNEMRKMHNLGSDTWYGRVCELAKRNNLDVDGYYTKREIKLAVAKTFKMHCTAIWMTQRIIPFCEHIQI